MKLNYKKLRVSFYFNSYCLILLLQGGVGDSNQTKQNIFMLTNTFMNNNQTTIKNNIILADLSINRIEAANNLTNYIPLKIKLIPLKKLIKIKNPKSLPSNSHSHAKFIIV